MNQIQKLVARIFRIRIGAPERRLIVDLYDDKGKYVGCIIDMAVEYAYRFSKVHHSSLTPDSFINGNIKIYLI